jgi:cytochrome c2
MLGWKRLSLLSFLVVTHLYGELPIKGDPLLGRKVFIEKNCVRCHSIMGAGGSLGPDLARVTERRSFYQLAGLFLSHSPKMIESIEKEGLEWPTFTPEEMSNLFAYLYYINYFDEPGNFYKGEEIFKKKACIRCHSVGGIGGKMASPLDTFAVYMSPILLAQEMWNKFPRMARKMRELGIQIPRFQKNDLAHILAYIRGMAAKVGFVRKFLPPGDPKKGEKLFKEKSCIACHKIYGKGGSFGPDLSERGLDRSVSEVAGILWNHAVKMRRQMETMGIPYPKFKGTELADLIAYLYFIHYFEERGDPVKGSKVFEEKGCIKCHGPAKIGPDLTKSPALESPFHFAAAMWNHTPTMKILAEEKLIKWPQFKGDEMKDLVAYLKKLRAKGK